MMQRLLSTLTLGALLLTTFSGTATAMHHPCYIPCTCPEYEPVVYVDEADTGVSEGPRGELLVTVAGMFYVDVEHLNSDGYLFSVWIAQESNGEEGYQHDGCDVSRDGDTIIF